MGDFFADQLSKIAQRLSAVKSKASDPITPANPSTLLTADNRQAKTVAYLISQEIFHQRKRKLFKFEVISSTHRMSVTAARKMSAIQSLRVLLPFNIKEIVQHPFFVCL